VVIGLDRGLGIVAVLAIHVGVFAWASAQVKPTPPRVLPQTLQGVLVPPQAIAPAQPEAALAPTPPPEPPPPQPPKPPPPKPRPPPKPPSEKAITVPAAPSEPATQSAPEPSAPAPTLPAVRPASSANAPPSEAPLIPPRHDAAHLSNPAPAYPSLSRRLGEQGKVLLDVHILPDGRVAEVRLRHSSGYRRLDEAAMNAVQHWRYVAAHRGDVPIAYWYVQPIVFSLHS
jgi:periplasmic protein TonB